VSTRVRIAIVGPTATGKSDLALDLADALGGAGGSGAEILNADASQLYRGMDIGTAKLPPSQRRGYPHHQIDVLSVRQDANVASYQVHARADLESIEARGNRALVVGGSGLYLRAVTDALEFPGTDPDTRAALVSRLEAEGAHSLWEALAGADPVSAQRIAPTDTRRLVRALEVMAVTGRPFSATLPRYEDLVPTVHLALRPYRPALNARIDGRARLMVDSGLIEETRELVAVGLRQGGTAQRAIGYAQALAVIDGRIDRDQAAADIAQATRSLASRQLKWFRRDPRIHWIDLRLTPEGACPDAERERVTQEALRIVRAAEARGDDVA